MVVVTFSTKWELISVVIFRDNTQCTAHVLNCTLLSTRTHQEIAKRLFKHFLPYTKSVHSKHTCRFPTLLVTKHSRTFREPRSIFPGPCRKPATLKYRDKQHLLAIYRGVYSMIAASILEYMFVTVMCCKQIAKKLFKHFLPLFCVCSASLCQLSASLPCKFQDFPGQNLFPRTFQVLEILQTQFQDFPGGVGTLQTSGCNVDSKRPHHC